MLHELAWPPACNALQSSPTGRSGSVTTFGVRGYRFESCPPCGAVAQLAERYIRFTPHARHPTKLAPCGPEIIGYLRNFRGGGGNRWSITRPQGPAGTRHREGRTHRDLDTPHAPVCEGRCPPGSQQRRGFHVRARQDRAPAPLPDARHRGRYLLRLRARYDREERRDRARLGAGGGSRPGPRSRRDLAGGARAAEQPGAVRARRRGSLGDEAGRRAALDALPLVARTGTHLFTVRAVRASSSAAGAAACAALSATGTSPGNRASSPTRCSSTGSAKAGRTATCCACPTRPARARTGPCSTSSAAVRLTSGTAAGRAFVQAQAATQPAQWVRLIRGNPALSWEMLPDAALSSPRVWMALLDSGHAADRADAPAPAADPPGRARPLAAAGLRRAPRRWPRSSPTPNGSSRPGFTR